MNFTLPSTSILGGRSGETTGLHMCLQGPETALPHSKITSVHTSEEERSGEHNQRAKEGSQDYMGNLIHGKSSKRSQ